MPPSTRGIWQIGDEPILTPPFIWRSDNRCPGRPSALAWPVALADTGGMFYFHRPHSAALLASILFAALAPLPAAAQDARDRMIVPGKRVGAITATSTQAELARIYGPANVRPTKIHVGEGEMAPGLTILPGTADEVKVQFAQTGRRIEFVRIHGRNSGWRTHSGIRMGMAAAALHKLNGRPFSITGFGWDYPGRVINWRGGRMGGPAKLLVLELGATRKVPVAAERKVLGEGPFSSAHPVIRQKQLVVRSMLIRLKP